MIFREQQRARHAYAATRAILDGPEAKAKDYASVIKDLGATIRRLGLAAALAELQRRGNHGGEEALKALREGLKEAGLPMLDTGSDDTFVRSVQGLDVNDYILVSREALKVSQWLKRAVQAEPKLGD